MTDAFPASRAAALERLKQFVPRAGALYAAQRNYDLGPGRHSNVSLLSPYLRHRVLTEEEVLRAVLGRHGTRSAEKFVQEVFWRTYWKGWLELRPGVWDSYRQGVSQARNRIQTEAGLRRDWESACRGETGIAAFDAWARELTETGYIHNHARMWVASIWIFTLRLPWELGADWFLRHLLDGDPASNTLSWRWVGGLHTKGKTYLAKADNIAKFTEGRVPPPRNLAAAAPPLEGPPAPEPGHLPPDDLRDTARPTGWLLTEEDLSPSSVLPADAEGPMCALNCSAGRSDMTVSPRVRDFTDALIDDALSRYGDRFDVAPLNDRGDPVGALVDWAKRHWLEQLCVPYAPVGPAAEFLQRADPVLADHGVRLVRIRRPYDTTAWPHATHGYFRFKANIPSFLSAMRRPDAA